MQAVGIKNLNFSYGNKKVFDNLNLSINVGTFTTILGNNGSGKTTLARILSGTLKYKGELSKSFKSNEIGFIDEIYEYDSDDLVMNVLIKEAKKLKKDDIRNKIFNISVMFNFSKNLDKSFDNLSFTQKKLVVLGSYLIQNIKMLILDNFFEDFDKNLKKEIIKKLKRFAKRENITVVNFSNDVDEIFYADDIIIIGDGKVLLDGSKRKVFEKEDVFEKYELERPFVVSLSDKLKFYDLIDKIYFDEKKLVDDLWK